MDGMEPAAQLLGLHVVCHSYTGLVMATHCLGYLPVMAAEGFRGRHHRHGNGRCTSGTQTAHDTEVPTHQPGAPNGSACSFWQRLVDVQLMSEE